MSEIEVKINLDKSQMLMNTLLSDAIDMVEKQIADRKAIGQPYDVQFILTLIEKLSFYAGKFDISGDNKKDVVMTAIKGVLYKFSDIVDIPYLPDFIEKSIEHFIINNLLADLVEYVYVKVVKPILNK